MADSILKLKVESSEYDAKLKKAAEGIRHLADVAHKGGGDLTGLEKAELDYIKALGDMETKSRSASGQVRELSSTYKELKFIYDQLNEVEKADEGGKALAASLETLRTRAQEAKAQLDSATQSLQSNGEAGQGTSGILEVLKDKFTVNIDAVKLFNMGLQAAEAALNVAKDAFFNNEEQLDEWGRVVESSHGLYTGFLNALNTGDISGYLSNINQIVQAARDAYDALDALGTYNAFNQINVERTRTNMTESIADYRGGKGSKDTVKAAGEAYKKELQDRKRLENEAYLAAVKRVAAERGVSAKDLTDALSGTYGHYQDLKNVQPTGVRQTVVGAGMFARTGTETFAQTRQEKLGEALRHLNDTELQSLQALGAQAQRTGNEIAQVDKQLTRVLNGRQPGVTGGSGGATVGGGGSRGGGKTTTPAQRAADTIKTAEQEYSRALEKAALEVEGGTINEAQQKQKQLQATEALWTAYGKASDMVNGSNQDYKTRQAELGQQIVALGGEAKSLQEAQKQAEEAYRQVAAQTQKLANAQEEANRAISSGDLKSFYSADKKITAAGGQSAITGMDMSQVFGATTANLDAFIGNLKERIASSEVGTDLYNALTAQLADATALSNLLQTAIKNGIDPAQIGLDPKEFWSKVFGENPGDYIKDETWQGIIDKMNKAQKKGGKNIQMNANTGEVTTKEDKGATEQLQAMNTMISSLGSIATGVQNLGIEVPQGITQGIAVLQTIMGIVSAIQTMQTVGTFLGIFANGGIVHAAGGYRVPGNNMSGDNVPALLNSGELVLNAAQTNGLAMALEGGGMQNLKLSATIRGEDIKLALNNNSRRTGRGEYVTSNFR